MAKKSRFAMLASAATTAAFADQLSRYTRFTADEINAFFPAKSDREELVELLKIVNSDTDDNTKKVELIVKIDKVGGAVIKIAKIFAP